MLPSSRRPSTAEEARKKVLPTWDQEDDGIELVKDEGRERVGGEKEEEEEEVDDWVSEDDNERDLVEVAEAQDGRDDSDDPGDGAGSKEHVGLDESVEGDLGIRKEPGRLHVKLDSDDDEGEPMSEEEAVSDS